MESEEYLAGCGAPAGLRGISAFGWKVKMPFEQNVRFPCKPTVITACLNAAATLEAALSSVLSQPCSDLEYIIIDGGSTDETLDIIEKYKHCFTHVITEPDRGIYDAFNKGLRLASGDIIGFLNADDQYAPWTLETISKAYSSNPECGVFYGKLAVVDEARQKWTVYPLGDHARLLDHMSIAHPATFVTRSMYEKYGFFDEHYKIAGDWDFILRLYLAGEKFCPVESVLSAFSCHGISSRPSRQLMKENREIYMKYLDHCTALKKISKMELKCLGRRVMDSTGLYGLYSHYRDRRLLLAEGTGKYENADSLWQAIKALGTQANRV